jgi:hypothetical protein
MDTLITTTCPHCGAVELSPLDVALVRSPREGLSWYLFDCTNCAQRIVKDAPPPVAVALLRADVALWTLPAEVLEREFGPPIVVDDVLDAVLALQGDCDVVALAERTAA